MRSTSPFRLVILDWEATTVADVTACISAARGPIDRLLRCGVLVVVITDVTPEDVANLWSGAIRGPAKRNLFLATNGGAVIYGFDEGSTPVLRWHLEKHATAAADAIPRTREGARADALWRIVHALAEPRGIRHDEILVVGRDAEPVAEIAARKLDSGSITFVSVGPDAAGPGPDEAQLDRRAGLLRELLGAQAALCPVTLPAQPEQDPEWVLVEEGFVPTREHEIESLFAIGNGFAGTRASLAEGSPLSSPATFVAGVFDLGPDALPVLARAPDWTYVLAAIDGSAFTLTDADVLEHRRVLDMRQGIVFRHWRHGDRAGRITLIDGMRLASLADRHLLLQSVAITPENYSDVVTLQTTPLARAGPLRTATGVTVDVAVATRIEDPEGKWTPRPDPEHDGPAGDWALDLQLGKTYRLDRVAVIHTSRDLAWPADPRAEAQRALDIGLETLVNAHRAAWRARWDASDVVIERDSYSQRAVRFAAYHLISAANPDDAYVSIGARALTGPAYKGHVFWDTEIFMLPFFTLTYPEAARALLMYRYHTLPAARARAQRLGYHGALYAWESADTGEDATPSLVITPTGDVIRLLVSEQEHHISADVAYGVWSYWHATGDDSFLLDAGAEILVETARFWASRVEKGPDGLHHILCVIGPDEYHESVDDNAYTNGMAQWNLETAAEVTRLVTERWPESWEDLARRVGLEPHEPEAWRDIARSMYTGLDHRTGVIEQFRGYFELEHIEVEAYEPRTVPMDVLLGRERIQRSQVIKQADVLMLIYLLWDRFPPEIREANFLYYESRTGHGSSLSPPIHAILAARLGNVARACRYFRQTIEIDLADRMGNAATGVHAAALGGLWQAVVFGFAGLTLTGDEPQVTPRLPDAWQALRFAIQWRGRRVPFDLRREQTARESIAEVRP